MRNRGCFPSPFALVLKMRRPKAAKLLGRRCRRHPGGEHEAQARELVVAACRRATTQEEDEDDKTTERGGLCLTRSKK